LTKTRWPQPTAQYGHTLCTTLSAALVCDDTSRVFSDVPASARPEWSADRNCRTTGPSRKLRAMGTGLQRSRPSERLRCRDVGRLCRILPDCVTTSSFLCAPWCYDQRNPGDGCDRQGGVMAQPSVMAEPHHYGDHDRKGFFTDT